VIDGYKQSEIGPDPGITTHNGLTKNRRLTSEKQMDIILTLYRPQRVSAL